MPLDPNKFLIVDGPSFTEEGQLRQRMQSTAIGPDDVAANTAARHSHANKAILDATTASFTTADADAVAANTEAILLKAIALTHTASVFVAKVGDDANEGTRGDLPKLTITSAIAQASALITAGAPAVRIWVYDGGTYTEDLFVPENVLIDARGATLVGAASLTGGSELYLDRHFPAADNASMLTLQGEGTGPAIYDCNISDGRGASGTLTGVKNIRNVGGGGRNLFARGGILYTGENGVGVGDVSTGDAGHIHIHVSDLYLAGNNSVGILGSAQGAGSSNIVGWVDHILEFGTPTGAVAISVAASEATVKLTASEIVVGTAFNIASGSLYLACPKIIGTRTGTPANLMIGTEDIDVTVQAYDADTAKTDEANEFTAGQRSTQHAVAYAASVTIDPDDSNEQVIGDLTGNITLENFSPMRPGQIVKLRMKQDATGGHTVTLGSYFKPYVGASAFPTAANAEWTMICDIVSATRIAYDVREIDLS